MSSNQQIAQFTDDTSKLSLATFTFQNASTSKSDLYLTLQVPESYGWGAVGIGNQMAGATMFIAYAASDKTNTTLSIRTAPDEVEPHHIDNPACATTNLVVQDSMIQASAVCYGYGSSDKLSANSANQDWIFAVGPSIQIDSDSVSAQIEKHSRHGGFTLDMSKAHRTALASPSATASMGMATAGPNVPVASGASNADNVETPLSNYYNLVNAHAALLAGSFIVLFPIAVLLLRFGSVRMHYLMNIFTMLLIVPGWIIALYMSSHSLEYDSFDQAHQIIGIITISLLLIAQLPGGAIAHMLYKKKGKRTILNTGHMFSGRIVVTLGLINGILGFLLSDDTTGAIVYGVIGLLVWICVLAISQVWMRKSAKKRGAESSVEKGSPTT